MKIEIDHIKETINVMNKGSLGLAVITGPGKTVLGFCSDGDIRKSKFSKDALITKIYSKRPYYVSENTNISNSLKESYNIEKIGTSETQISKKKTRFI